jgi:hypothetical protein
MIEYQDGTSLDRASMAQRQKKKSMHLQLFFPFSKTTTCCTRRMKTSLPLLAPPESQHSSVKNRRILKRDRTKEKVYAVGTCVATYYSTAAHYNVLSIPVRPVPARLICAKQGRGYLSVFLLEQHRHQAQARQKKKKSRLPSSPSVSLRLSPVSSQATEAS